MNISAKYVTQDLKNFLLLKCRGKYLLERVISLLSDHSHIFCTALSRCLVMGNNSAVLLSS